MSDRATGGRTIGAVELVRAAAAGKAIYCEKPTATEFDEAVRLANDTPYGLTDYVQSQDGEKRNRVARQLRAGMIEMNGRPRGAGAPFGGMKASGNGREGGVWGLEDFTEVKAVSGWADA